MGCDSDLRDLAPKQREMWETQEGHIIVEIREIHKQTRSHDTAEQKMEKSDQLGYNAHVNVWLPMSISVNKQPIVLMSVYMPHSGYPDHHVEKNIQNDHHDD